MKPRKNFFADELNLDRMNEVLNSVISTLTLKEVLKMVREISYDMVCYYDEYNKGIIYSDNKYSELNQVLNIDFFCCARVLNSAYKPIEKAGKIIYTFIW